MVSLYANNYYKEQPQFHSYPDPNSPRYPIKRLGPIGIGLDLRKPNFTMFISNIEKGSPAEASGKLKKGQLIESINGITLKDKDPRIILGDLITNIEKTGSAKLMVKDSKTAKAKQVVIKIPALGVYSKSWPDNCKKSDTIVRKCADTLAKHKESVGVGLDGAMLFLLSTGEEKDLEVVRGWIKKLVAKYKDSETINTYPWFAGYNGPALCEYYLRTGDESILPVIEKIADYLKRTIYNGSWMGRGGASYSYMGGGHMNAAGVHCVAFLLMAKECGVNVDEHTLQSSLLHFFRFAGRGNVAYGDGVPEGGMVDNGRVTGLAYAMAAAANLTPEGEQSVYAKARDISATKGFYSTNWLFHGHTGGGIGEIWRGQSMAFVKEKRKLQYRTFMDGRRWMYELARTHQGTFGWVSGWNVSYDDIGINGRGFGNYIPLIYTIPRKQLRLYGAPRTKFSKPYQLPKRPWGTAADDAFYSLIPGEYLPGKRQAIENEKLITDGSMPIMNRINRKDVSDETLLMYAHHIDQGIRDAAARAINHYNRSHLIVPLLKSKDPRGRLTGIRCITGMFKGKALATDKITDEMFNLIAKRIGDPDESWWVVEGALNAIGRARARLVAPYVDEIYPWLEHSDWWLRKAALSAVTPLASDKNHYDDILPRVAAMIIENQRPVALSPLRGIVEQLKNADPEIQQYAKKAFSYAYQNFPNKLHAPGGQELDKNIPGLLDTVASAMTGTPGGYDELFKISLKRYPKQSLPHSKLFFGAETSQFGPELKNAFLPIIMNEMIPEYINKNRKNLDREIKARQPGRAIDGLVSLYRKAGIRDYDWKRYGPAREKIDWKYTTFDPVEKKLWEGGHRFRQVSPPKGSEKWFTPEFNPASQGWKTGKAPFANHKGKLDNVGGCVGTDTFCGCGNPPATFWDKEAILMRAKISLPPAREGYAYRLLVGGRSHYNAGGGTDVWIDGQHLKNRRRGVATIPGGSGRNSYRAWGVTIDNKHIGLFKDGEVLLACNGFLRWGHKTDFIRSYKTFWFEEMKLPVLPKATK
jgi:hypothetical protein